MSQHHSHVVMFVFPTRGRLVDASDYLRRRTDIRIKNTAVIARAADGETVVLEDDINPDEGAITGGTFGGLLGSMGVASLGAFLLPGVGAILAIGAGALLGGLLGAATGGLTARVIDLGIDNAVLKDLASRLERDQVAMVIEYEGDDPLGTASSLAADMRQYEAEVVTVPVRPTDDVGATSRLRTIGTSGTTSTLNSSTGIDNMPPTGAT